MLRQQSRLWGDLGCIEGLSEEQEEEEDVIDKGDVSLALIATMILIA